MKIKNNGIQVLMWVICAVLAVGLFFMVRTDRKQTTERIAELRQQAAAAEQESGEKLEAKAAIYDDLIADLKIGDIVCWGDSEMAGNNSISLADALQQTTIDNLSALMNKTFGKAIQDDEHALPKVTINNMGVTNEGMQQILARAGVTEIETSEWIQIPGDTDPVTLSLRDDGNWSGDDSELRFAKQNKVSFGKVWISDIEGTLVTTDDWYDSVYPRYAFKRDEEGYGLGVGAGTVVEIESATKYIGDVPVFFFSDDSARSVDGFVSDLEELVDRYAGSDEDEEEEDENAYVRPFVIVCTAEEGSELDHALQDAFGSRYIRNDTYENEMDEKSYTSLAQQVYENLDNQGCFSSVKDRIARAIQEAEGL